MKKVDFNKLQAGDLVEVPRTQFAPMRRGWNGWLFSEAVVIRKGVGRKSKKNNKARKCKRHRKDVLIFTKDKEENLDKVREDIINLAYEPSKYHYFKVYEPKERQIMALPFYDRVVQHAIRIIRT